MTEISDRTIQELASRYSVSPSAVRALMQAVRAGNGTMAQFNHPELGGMGQWTRGGMTMVGDMFNNSLKTKVDGLSSEIAHLLEQVEAETPASGPSTDQMQEAPLSSVRESSPEIWWGGDFGKASAKGSQNNMRYAYFAQARRLAIKTEDGTKVYDTGDHEIRGVSQQQSGNASLSFVSQHGVVPVEALKVVETIP